MACEFSTFCTYYAFLSAHDVNVFDINYNYCNNRKTFFQLFGAEEMT